MIISNSSHVTGRMMSRVLRRIISLTLYTAGDYVYFQVMLRCKSPKIVNMLYHLYCMLMVTSNRVDTHDDVWQQPAQQNKKT